MIGEKGAEETKTGQVSGSKDVGVVGIVEPGFGDVAIGKYMSLIVDKETSAGEVDGEFRALGVGADR